MANEAGVIAGDVPLFFSPSSSLHRSPAQFSAASRQWRSLSMCIYLSVEGVAQKTTLSTTLHAFCGLVPHVGRPEAGQTYCSACHGVGPRKGGPRKGGRDSWRPGRRAVGGSGGEWLRRRCRLGPCDIFL
jgi:hypothetical protein